MANESSDEPGRGNDLSCCIVEESFNFLLLEEEGASFLRLRFRGSLDFRDGPVRLFRGLRSDDATAVVGGVVSGSIGCWG